VEDSVPIDQASKTSEFAIFARLIKADKGDMSRQLARFILTLGFDDEDQDRMRDLAERNQKGSLSSEDYEELDNYVKAGHLLALLQSKARKSLKSKKASSVIHGRLVGQDGPPTRTSRL
jgi:hypothetical protein